MSSGLIGQRPVPGIHELNDKKLWLVYKDIMKIWYSQRGSNTALEDVMCDFYERAVELQKNAEPSEAFSKDLSDTLLRYQQLFAAAVFADIDSVKDTGSMDVVNQIMNDKPKIIT